MAHSTLTKKRLEKRHQQHPQDKDLHKTLEKGDGRPNLFKLIIGVTGRYIKKKK